VGPLVEEARRGNRRAFDEIVRELEKPLKGYILGEIRGDDAAADEIAQDTWVAVWEQMHKSPEEGGYDPGKGAFYTFVINRVAKFKIRQWWSEAGSARFRAGEAREVPEPADARQLRPDELLIQQEDLRRRHAAFCELFRLTFLCGGYPHQQLAFGFSRHIYGKESDRGIEGAPARVVQDHGAVPLEALVEAYWDDYRKESQIRDSEGLGQLRECLDPVRARLPLRVGELVRLDPASSRELVGVGDRAVGRTQLQDYYSGRAAGAAAAISDWCYQVADRVREVLALTRGTCGRCRLRHVPPCQSATAGRSAGTGGEDRAGGSEARS